MQQDLRNILKMPQDGSRLPQTVTDFWDEESLMIKNAWSQDPATVVVEPEAQQTSLRGVCYSGIITAPLQVRLSAQLEKP
jgi:hypothetical protein